MVSSGRVPRLRSSAVLFFRVSPATTREDGDGEARGGGEREAAHHWRRWGNEVTESESE